jgi:hypothetical protein
MSTTDYNTKCNNEVKLCQTCFFFEPIVFDYEDEGYYDEELGVFDLWIWEGACTCNLKPAKGLNFYHKTKSNKKCEYYLTEEEAKELQKRTGKEAIDVMVFVLTLREIRKEREE